jgi:hypothetical protein
VLGILNNFASRDLPGRQAEMMADIKQILAKVSANGGSGGRPPD